MQKLMNAIASHLLAAARTRAECAMNSVAEARVRPGDIYRSNMGGWNEYPVVDESRKSCRLLG
jgi:hypothetical protein